MLLRHRLQLRAPAARGAPHRHRRRDRRQFPIQAVCADFTDVQARGIPEPGPGLSRLFTLTGFTLGNYREAELVGQHRRAHGRGRPPPPGRAAAPLRVGPADPSGLASRAEAVRELRPPVRAPLRLRSSGGRHARHGRRREHRDLRGPLDHRGARRDQPGDPLRRARHLRCASRALRFDAIASTWPSRPAIAWPHSPSGSGARAASRRRGRRRPTTSPSSCCTAV